MSTSRLKDQMIIHELQRDARQSNVALAAKLGISEGAIRRRVDRLVRDGHVRFIAIADPAYMGYALHVMIRIQTEPDKGDQVIDDLVAMPELSYVYHCTGQFNIAVVGYFRSTDDLREFTSDRLGRLPGVVEVRTVIILRVAKRSQELPVDMVIDGSDDGAD
ncbi:MAG: Lrp/AsnC family transcriptional regulator [Microbacterium sp.]